MKAFAQEVTEEMEKDSESLSVPSVASCEVACLVGYALG